MLVRPGGLMCLGSGAVCGSLPYKCTWCGTNVYFGVHATCTPSLLFIRLLTALFRALSLSLSRALSLSISVNRCGQAEGGFKYCQNEPDKCEVNPTAQQHEIRYSTLHFGLMAPTGYR